MALREPPLTDRELKVLRGMVDEYVYRMHRRRTLREFAHDGRVLFGGLAGLMLVSMQCAELYLIATGHR